MKADWRTVPLGEVSAVIAGQSPKGSAYNDSGIGLPFYQGKKEFGDRHIGAPTTWTSEVTKVAKAGDILMSVRAPVGPINEATEEICIGRGLAAIRATNGLNRDFLWYVLQWLQPTITGNAGAVFESINKTTIEQLSIPFPGAEEQQRIVAILDEAFEGLDRARANAEANLQNARELFGSALDAAFADDAIAWNDAALAELGSVVTGSTPKTSDDGNLGDHVPFVKPGDFLPNGSLVYNNQGLSEKGASVSRVLPAGSALMVCIGATIGKAGYSDRPIATNQQINAVIPKSGVDGEYLYYQMLTPAFQAKVMHASGQATLPIINKSKWSKLTVRVPCDLSKQAEIVDMLSNLRAQIDMASVGYQAQTGDLQNLRQSLLQKAFAGELT